MVNASCGPDNRCYESCEGLFDGLIPRMERLVPGALDITIREELTEALKQFCIDAEIWRFVFELVQTHVGEHSYRIPEQDESKVIRVVKLFQGGDERGCGERVIPERKDVDRTHCEQFWYESEPGLLVLNLVTESAETLRANVVLRPAENSSRFPVELWERWRQAVEYRALSELYLRPQMPWSELERANYYGQLYAEQVKQAKQVHALNMKPHRPAYRNPNGISFR